MAQGRLGCPSPREKGAESRHPSLREEGLGAQLLNPSGAGERQGWTLVQECVGPAMWPLVPSEPCPWVHMDQDLKIQVDTLPDSSEAACCRSPEIAILDSPHPSLGVGEGGGLGESWVTHLTLLPISVRETPAPGCAHEVPSPPHFQTGGWPASCVENAWDPY